MTPRYKSRPRGAESHAWKGGRITKGKGYVGIYTPGHPRAVDGYVPEHILVVERAMGKHLRRSALVHHVDENKANNAGLNLVACDSAGYHLLLHQRMRALSACGDANARRCRICKGYARQGEMYVRDGGPERRVAYHRDCHAANQARLKLARAGRGMEAHR